MGGEACPGVRGRVAAPSEELGRIAEVDRTTAVDEAREPVEVSATDRRRIRIAELF
jgi:hypothetical protein